MGEPLLPLHVNVVPLIVMLLAFFVAALGGVWLRAVCHIVAMVQAGQSWARIAWGCLDMGAARVIMVWLDNGAGKSVFAVALYHAIANSSMKTVFPAGHITSNESPA